MIVLRCDECGKETTLWKLGMDHREWEQTVEALGWNYYKPEWDPAWNKQDGPDRCPECRERLGVEPICDFAEA